MSWQQYVDSMMASKNMTHVGIFGLDGASWAASENYPIDTNGIKNIIDALSDASKISNGLKVGSDRYILVRSDPNVSIMLKKGPNGVVAYKSSKSVIVAMHDQSNKAEITLTTIGKIVDYLSGHGF